MADNQDTIRQALAAKPERIVVGEVRDVSAGERLNPWRGEHEWD